MAQVYKIPGEGYLVKQRTFHTTYRQNKQTGRMIGRKGVEGTGDGTGVLRVEKPFTLVKKSNRARGHIRKIKIQYLPGQIMGRY